MKTVFVVNPKAGKKNNVEALTRKIKAATEKLKADVEIYETKSVGDASDYVRAYCEKKGSARFIACGGDGTLCEVLNSAVLFDGAEVGVMPFGTGNDFIKNFDGDFSDVKAQITSESEKCDIIKYTTTDEKGNKRVGYCANMFNIGFDCNVADTMTEMKKKPFVSGSLAYVLAIFAMLIKKKGADLEIILDGKEKYNGRLLLTSIANGCFCGGGIKSNPAACVHDGLMNVNIIKDISRLRFISLLPHYMKGTHPYIKGIEKIIDNEGCKRITIRPRRGIMRLCIDGEISSAGETEFEIIHDAFNFVVPEKAEVVTM